MWTAKLLGKALNFDIPSKFCHENFYARLVSLNRKVLSFSMPKKSLPEAVVAEPTNHPRLEFDIEQILCPDVFLRQSRCLNSVPLLASIYI